VSRSDSSPALSALADVVAAPPDDPDRERDRTAAKDEITASIDRLQSSLDADCELELLEARQRIFHLEREIARNDVVISSTNREMVAARKKMRVLEERLVVIEKLTVRDLEGSSANGLRKELDVVREERDEARRLVGDIGRLIGRGQDL
jgi:hypothetical protein